MRTDLAVVGGGIMGCCAALQAAGGGMSVLVLDQGELGGGASGVNAGTLSLQIKRAALMPYALRGREMWERAGEAVGYHRTGGHTLAFTDAEAALLTERMTARRAAGAPIELVSPNRIAVEEPGLGRVVLASWCPLDGFANSSLTGAYYRAHLREAGIPYREHCPVIAVERREPTGFRIETPHGTVQAARLLLACGAWLRPTAAMIGLDLPVRARINTVTVTERAPHLMRSVIGHASGLLTLKQKPNGTVLIGGGWQGRGTPQEGRGEVLAEPLLTNLRLAQFAVPGLAGVRVLRSWTGFEAHVPDHLPLAGAAPGVPDAFVLGCVRGGYTIGPCIGALIGDLILGREPALPLFDPGRSFELNGALAS